MFSPRFHGSFRVAGTGTFNSYIHAIYVPPFIVIAKMTLSANLTPSILLTTRDISLSRGCSDTPGTSHDMELLSQFIPR